MDEHEPKITKSNLAWTAGAVILIFLMHGLGYI